MPDELTGDPAAVFDETVEVLRIPDSMPPARWHAEVTTGSTSNASPSRAALTFRELIRLIVGIETQVDV